MVLENINFQFLSFVIFTQKKKKKVNPLVS